MREPALRDYHRPAVQMFHLVHSDRQEYRCDYCDEEAKF